MAWLINYLFQAEHLTDIRDEIVIQAREKLTDVEDLLSRVLDLAANSPPFAYLLVVSKAFAKLGKSALSFPHSQTIRTRWANGSAKRDDIADNHEE